MGPWAELSVLSLGEEVHSFFFSDIFYNAMNNFRCEAYILFFSVIFYNAIDNFRYESSTLNQPLP